MMSSRGMGSPSRVETSSREMKSASVSCGCRCRSVIAWSKSARIHSVEIAACLSPRPAKLAKTFSTCSRKTAPSATGRFSVARNRSVGNRMAKSLTRSQPPCGYSSSISSSHRLEHQRLEPPHCGRGEPAVQHPAHRGVLGRVEVLGEQVEGVLRGQRADDLVAEHIRHLQRLEHVLVIGDHPERPQAGVVPEERASVALGVEQLVGLEQRPLDRVVGVADGAATGLHDLGFCLGHWSSAWAKK